ncbi:MAG: hypothetical protein KBA31_18110 [Alphaproteobacteria bacterium]|nr:hypothetical protein [Alphaproteobacteria bacterium]
MDLKKAAERGAKVLARRFVVSRLPKWPYLVAAAAVAAFGHWLSTIEIVEPLKQLSAQLLADLRVISPLNVIGAYYYSLIGCDAGIVDGAVTANCDTAASVWQQMERYGLGGISKMFWPIVMLLQTALLVWETSGWMGRVIYLATLPVGAIGAMAVVERVGDDRDDWTMFGWIITAALLPLFAGAAALVSQWLLIAILWAFGQALGAIVWAATVAAAPFAYFKGALGLMKEARQLEKEHAVIKGEK